MAQMPTPEIGDDTSTKPSLTRVEWFRREPGGGTLFVKAAGEERATEPSDAIPDATDGRIG